MGGRTVDPGKVRQFVSESGYMGAFNGGGGAVLNLLTERSSTKNAILNKSALLLISVITIC